MRMTSPLKFLCLALLSGSAWAQGLVQNMDIFFLFGPARVESQVIGGSGVTVYSSTGYSQSTGYGYQVMRKSAASLWVEFFPITFTNPGKSTASIAGSINYRMNTFAPGVRFMVPVQSRISVYGVLGGGAGFFNYATIAGESSPYVKSNSTTHGVFDFGGGVDVRLARRISLRGEVRDYVTGAGLSGTVGRNHILPLVGVALHF
ncbi:MAG: hypothetical protein LAQ69_05360 [Acidobacteriia bacterium]|nr:hypothetical protein [Terriglobia bacterium]